MHGRAARRGHEPDTPDPRRQRPLATGLEQPLGLQPLLEPDELAIEVAGTGLAHPLDGELKVASGLVEPGRGQHLDLDPFSRGECDPGRCRPEHHGTHAGPRILEREVPMAAGRARDVRQFAADPEPSEASLQQSRGLAIQLRDRDHRRGGRARWCRGRRLRPISGRRVPEPRSQRVVGEMRSVHKIPLDTVLTIGVGVRCAFTGRIQVSF